MIEANLTEAERAAAARKVLTERQLLTEGGLHRQSHILTIDDDYYPAVLTDARLWSQVDKRLAALDRIEFRIGTTRIVDAVLVDIIHGGKKIKIIPMNECVLRDTGIEAPKATGDWYSWFSGDSRRWCTIDPQGRIRHEGFTSKQNADHVCHQQAASQPLTSMAGR